jgi:hypothetical protein
MDYKEFYKYNFRKTSIMIIIKRQEDAVPILEWKDGRLDTGARLHVNIQSYNYGACAGHHREIICIFLADWMNASFDKWLLAVLVGTIHVIKTSHICK